MDLRLYDSYAALAAQGRRKEAGAALRAFVVSVTTLADKRRFTQTLLATHAFGRGFRSELLHGVVLPALLEGYQRRDPWSLYWLAGVGVDPARVEGKGPIALLKDCLALDWEPERVRDTLLRELLAAFAYAAHEWPAGILSGADGATLAQCAQLMEDVRLARTLDRDGRHAAQLNEFEGKLDAYHRRLEARAPTG